VKPSVEAVKEPMVAIVAFLFCCSSRAHRGLIGEATRQAAVSSREWPVFVTPQLWGITSRAVSRQTGGSDATR
jgi:hypothetical protein